MRVQLEPRGMTALLDALGDSLEGFRSALSAMPAHAQPATVQVVVVTDGHENASRRWTHDRVTRLITGLIDVIDARLVAFLRWQQRRWS